ncbi:MAG: alanine racemase [Chloroflexi bacterium]|nr:alanine racemase [Chloroflexota bacterium]
MRPPIEVQLHEAGLPPLTRPAWLGIDTDALAGNISAIRARVGPTTAVWPVVKADAYGHGIEVAARTFALGGADGLCVATLEEARAVRAAGVELPVLVLYPILPGDLGEAAQARFEVVVSALEGARALAGAWSGDARVAPLVVHVEVETGLMRMGVPLPDLDETLRELARPGIEVRAVWSHLATPEDAATTDAQAGTLAAALTMARHHVPAIGWHLAATGGVLTGTGTSADRVRPGLLAYGIQPDLAGLELAPLPGIRPAMRLVARILRVAEAPVGTRVGYGGTWVAQRPSRIATLPVGYGDGVPRAQSGAPVLLRGQRVPIVGVIAMDGLALDVTDVPDVRAGDEVVLLGRQGGDVIDARELARWRTTIPWEVVTGMARRLTRVYDAPVGPLGVRTQTGETLVRGSWS